MANMGGSIQDVVIGRGETSVRNLVFDIGVLSLFAFSLFGLLSLIMSVYGIPKVSAVFDQGYLHTYRLIVPFFGGEGIYGIDALFYFLEMLLAFFIINRGRGDREATVLTLEFGFSVAAVFEFGLLVFAPNFTSWYVISAQEGTPFQWFSNRDLLILSLSALIAISVWKTARRTKLYS